MKTHWKCKKCGASHSNPWVECGAIHGTDCNKKENNLGFMGYIR